MSLQRAFNQRFVMGPDGVPLSVCDLPPATTARWVIRRKAEVVYAVRGGLLTIDDAISRYNLSIDEFLGWQASVALHGMKGLRTCQTQKYRQKSAEIARRGDSRRAATSPVAAPKPRQ